MDEDEKDITLELAELESHKEITSHNEVIFFSISIGVILCCLAFAWGYHSDDEIQVFACPVNREMDAPVALKKVNDLDNYEAENFIRGFVRQYVRALYPKNSSEAPEHFRFITLHSLGKEKSMYAGFARDVEKIGRELDQGKTTDFFPIKPISDPESIVMAKSDSGTWIVEIDGFLNNRTSALEDDRGAVTLRLEIVKGKARYGGSYSGLYVNSVDILTMTNSVSNNQKSVK